MMQDIVKAITEKTGISEAQATTAVETVLQFVKDKLPAGMGSQVDAFVKGGSNGGGSDMMGGLGKLGGMFGQ